MTHRRTWQKREQSAAAIFGAQRNVGSGSQNRSDKSRSDSTHETLYIECKHAARHAVVTLWDDANTKAKKEKKIPVVCLSVKHRPGRWFLIKDEHLQQIAAAVDIVTVSE
jgi:hypothetical protein